MARGQLRGVQEWGTNIINPGRLGMCSVGILYVPRKICKNHFLSFTFPEVGGPKSKEPKKASFQARGRDWRCSEAKLVDSLEIGEPSDVSPRPSASSDREESG